MDVSVNTRIPDFSNHFVPFVQQQSDVPKLERNTLVQSAPDINPLVHVLPDDSHHQSLHLLENGSSAITAILPVGNTLVANSLPENPFEFVAQDNVSRRVAFKSLSRSSSFFDAESSSQGSVSELSLNFSPISGQSFISTTIDHISQSSLFSSPTDVHSTFSTPSSKITSPESSFQSSDPLNFLTIDAPTTFPTLYLTPDIQVFPVDPLNEYTTTSPGLEISPRTSPSLSEGGYGFSNSPVLSPDVPSLSLQMPLQTERDNSSPPNSPFDELPTHSQPPTTRTSPLPKTETKFSSISVLPKITPSLRPVQRQYAQPKTILVAPPQPKAPDPVPQLFPQPPNRLSPSINQTPTILFPTPASTIHWTGSSRQNRHKNDLNHNSVHTPNDSTISGRFPIHEAQRPLPPKSLVFLPTQPTLQHIQSPQTFRTSPALPSNDPPFDTHRAANSTRNSPNLAPFPNMVPPQRPETAPKTITFSSPLIRPASTPTSPDEPEGPLFQPASSSCPAQFFALPYRVQNLLRMKNQDLLLYYLNLFPNLTSTETFTGEFKQRISFDRQTTWISCQHFPDNVFCDLRKINRAQLPLVRLNVQVKFTIVMNIKPQSYFSAEKPFLVDSSGAYLHSDSGST